MARHLIPALARHDLVARRQAVAKRIADGIRRVGEFRDGAPRIAVPPDREIDEGDRHVRRPVRERIGARRRVVLRVILLALRIVARHADPPRHLACDERAVGPQQVGDVVEEAHRAENDALVGRSGERSAVDVDRRRRVRRDGVADEVRILLRQAVPRIARPLTSARPRTADGDVGTSVVGVDDLADGDGLVALAPRVAADGDDLAFTSVRQRVQDRERTHVVVVRVHVGVEDDTRHLRRKAVRRNGHKRRPHSQGLSDHTIVLFSRRP